ncbi:hypothetical protein ACVIEM_000989 [Rhizobium leguminosarum]
MARPRSDGAFSVASLPSMTILPPETSSSPAISRSSVDLPQPDGPTKTTNSPSLMSRSIEGMTLASPKTLETY